MVLSNAKIPVQLFQKLGAWLGNPLDQAPPAYLFGDVNGLAHAFAKYAGPLKPPVPLPAKPTLPAKPLLPVPVPLSAAPVTPPPMTVKPVKPGVPKPIVAAPAAPVVSAAEVGAIPVPSMVKPPVVSVPTQARPVTVSAVTAKPQVAELPTEPAWDRVKPKPLGDLPTEPAWDKAPRGGYMPAPATSYPAFNPVEQLTYGPVTMRPAFAELNQQEQQYVRALVEARKNRTKPPVMVGVPPERTQLINRAVNEMLKTAVDTFMGPSGGLAKYADDWWNDKNFKLNSPIQQAQANMPGARQPAQNQNTQQPFVNSDADAKFDFGANFNYKPPFAQQPNNPPQQQAGWGGAGVNVNAGATPTPTTPVNPLTNWEKPRTWTGAPQTNPLGISGLPTIDPFAQRVGEVEQPSVGPRTPQSVRDVVNRIGNKITETPGNAVNEIPNMWREATAERSWMPNIAAPLNWTLNALKSDEPVPTPETAKLLDMQLMASGTNPKNGNPAYAQQWLQDNYPNGVNDSDYKYDVQPDVDLQYRPSLLDTALFGPLVAKGTAAGISRMGGGRGYTAPVTPPTGTTPTPTPGVSGNPGGFYKLGPIDYLTGGATYSARAIPGVAVNTFANVGSKILNAVGMPQAAARLGRLGAPTYDTLMRAGVYAPAVAAPAVIASHIDANARSAGKTREERLTELSEDPHLRLRTGGDPTSHGFFGGTSKTMSTALGPLVAANDILQSVGVNTGINTQRVPSTFDIIKGDLSRMYGAGRIALDDPVGAADEAAKRTAQHFTSGWLADVSPSNTKYDELRKNYQSIVSAIRNNNKLPAMVAPDVEDWENSPWNVRHGDSWTGDLVRKGLANTAMDNIRTETGNLPISSTHMGAGVDEYVGSVLARGRAWDNLRKEYQDDPIKKEVFDEIYNKYKDFNYNTDYDYIKSFGTDIAGLPFSTKYDRQFADRAYGVNRGTQILPDESLRAGLDAKLDLISKPTASIFRERYLAPALVNKRQMYDDANAYVKKMLAEPRPKPLDQVRDEYGLSQDFTDLIRKTMGPFGRMTQGIREHNVKNPTVSEAPETTPTATPADMFHPGLSAAAYGGAAGIGGIKSMFDDNAPEGANDDIAVSAQPLGAGAALFANPLLDSKGQAAAKNTANTMLADSFKEVAPALAGAGGGAIATATIEHALAKVDNMPAPPGFRKYWDELPRTSRFLAIGGLSLAAIMMLRRMFGGKDDDKEDPPGFLEQVLPLLGLGVGLWGAAGGTLSSLPEMKHIHNLGDAFSANFKDIGGMFNKK